ncbi:DUF1428 domain-containing protein [Novosphingobium sp. TH158]|uniref:DUF1428 domain-containing protein n=1 Tax=Novosphingobium sp. TH158 TaxID=2067455 RepID=UPI000C7A2FFA|nr:DUF1428 domain-containing protein [Novosphingobium sp. TH158]PLK25540.1 DUF1428 domain-containing protein [Novosphingobium sp. TH158]
MSYIDGFLIPVPHDRREDYRQLAEMAAPVFMDHGAIEVVECWGDDLMRGKSTDFYMAVMATEAENVVFSWIKWPDKETRDAGNKAAMEDERFAGMEAIDVFDGKRMIFSGFVPILEARK